MKWKPASDHPEKEGFYHTNFTKQAMAEASAEKFSDEKVLVIECSKCGSVLTEENKYDSMFVEICTRCAEKEIANGA